MADFNIPAKTVQHWTGLGVLCPGNLKIEWEWLEMVYISKVGLHLYTNRSSLQYTAVFFLIQQYRKG